MLKFLNHGMFDTTLNAIYIVLILKIKNPTRHMEYRPIRLCNVLYKLIAKVLANRLKPILPNIIPPSQSVFILGQLIIDNILVVFEEMHTMDDRMLAQ
jgi:hypothetical protein